MLLYHYTKLQYGLAAIRDKRVKISLYETLNDPLDFMGLVVETKQEHTALEQIRRELSRKSGIICLSETWQEPLMWGHYAESHRGVCLGFEVYSMDYVDIKYRPTRTTLSEFGKKSITELSDAERMIIASRKFDRWNYEREWRRIVPLENRDIVDRNFYLSFGDNMRLRTLLFGCKATVSKDVVKGIIESIPDIRIGLTKLANSAFTVELDHNRTRHFVPKDNRLRELIVEDPVTIKDIFAGMFVNWLKDNPGLQNHASKLVRAFETAAKIRANTIKSRAEILEKK